MLENLLAMGFHDKIFALACGCMRFMKELML